MMINYFQIIEESNEQLLKLINKQRIQANQYFPIFAFFLICPEINRTSELKKQQTDKIKALVDDAPTVCKGNHRIPQDVIEDDQIPATYKETEIVCSIMSGIMDLDLVETYLKNFPNKRITNYRKILCAYDLKRNI